MKEFEIKFSIEDGPKDSAFIWVEDGKMHTENVEECFFKFLRHAQKDLLKAAAEYEKEKMIDMLTADQEEKLKEAHAKDYIGTDDDMPDAYEDWMVDLSLDELRAII